MVELLNNLGFKLLDFFADLSEVFAVKDELEVKNIRKATFFMH